jgi:hypothetical protein
MSINNSDEQGAKKRAHHWLQEYESMLAARDRAVAELRDEKQRADGFARGYSACGVLCGERELESSYEAVKRVVGECDRAVAEAAAVREVAATLHDTIDRLMGDSDCDADDSFEMRAMQKAAGVLNTDPSPAVREMLAAREVAEAVETYMQDGWRCPCGMTGDQLEVTEAQQRYREAKAAREEEG